MRHEEWRIARSLKITNPRRTTFPGSIGKLCFALTAFIFSYRGHSANTVQGGSHRNRRKRRYWYYKSLHVIIFVSGFRVFGAEFEGDWALVLPSQEAGWLSVHVDGEKTTAELLWAVGSPKPIPSLEVKDDILSFTKSIKNPSSPKQELAVLYRIDAAMEGDVLRCEMKPMEGGQATPFVGKRMPPLPARPEIDQIVFGEPIPLFNGRDLTGWHVSNPAKKNGWSVRDGVLCNDTPKTDFGAYGEFANLRTDADFDDFQLHIEYRLPAEIGGNSGVYLRGLYEVQVTHRDSTMQGINGPGAVFGRIAPEKNAGLPAGEWESLDVTLVARHVTVVLNGLKVIDNEPIAGPTGGALHSDVTASGPIYLQGDHTSVQYRNITLRSVMP